MDPICLTQEQQQNLNDLVKACQFLVELKRRGMAESAIDSIDQVAAALNKIKVAA